MRIWGKLLGGALGFALGHDQGAAGVSISILVGVFLGHQLDRKKQGKAADTEFDYSTQEKAQTAYFVATFSVMGHISKADGRVSPEEIQLAEQVMQQMNLDEEQRIAAIEYFNYGKQEDFNLNEVLGEFRQECHQKTALMQMFIEIQLQAAYADGSRDIREEQILQHICGVLGYPRMLLEQMEAILVADKRSHQSNDSGAMLVLDDAYEIMGVNPSVSDSEVKKAYRRLMSKNHPDKLISKGLSEEMIEIATNKTQEIQKAYDLIVDSRGK